MGQTIQHDRYPKFVADQVLTEKSLNQMFGYLEEQQRLTRTALIGIGVMCGMKVSVNDSGTVITISQGVGVTSKGYLVTFPETTYTFYNDQFSAEQEFLYKPFIDPITQKQKFPLYLLHNNGAAEIQKPITPAFLEDKVVVIFVELLKVENKNCDPDSCDDKGCTVEVTHRPLLVDAENLDELVYGANDEKPFLHEPSCIEWPEIRMPRYNVPSTLLLNSAEVLKNFLKVLDDTFLLEVEKVLEAAYSSFGYYIKDEFPSNPFSGLKNRFKFLFDGSITTQQVLYAQYYYDFFSDVIYAYEELRRLCNECLTICCPNEDLFPRHLILGNAISTEDEFRHHWIQSPAFSCSCCSEGRIKFLLKKIVLLIQKLDIPFSSFSQDKQRVKITPSSYGDVVLSDKAIPYYYDITNSPDELYDHWNFKKSKLKKGDTNLSYDRDKYGANKYIQNPLDYDIEPYNFFRIEGHLGLNWKNALAEVKKIKNEKRLPIDVVALNGDIFELFRSLLSSTDSLGELISGNRDIAEELICYFADIESQYDAQAAELRCTIQKVMVYFYNLPVILGQGTPETQNFPQSTMIRKAFPQYKTKANTYGDAFDKFYEPIKNADYISPLAFSSAVGFGAIGIANNQLLLLNPIYLMYYLEKIYEALPDGLVELKINVLTQRLQDASNVAGYMLLLADAANVGDNNIELPSLWEESLGAVTWICKAEVFNVLYKNFLFNYALFISNQTFAMYAFRNSGIQHKAGVSNGGTFIMVYNDKREIRSITVTGRVSDVTGAPLPGVNIIVKGTTTGTITDFNGNYTITVPDPDNSVLVVSSVGYQTREEQVKGRTSVNITLGATTGPDVINDFVAAFADISRAEASVVDQGFRAFVSSKQNVKATSGFSPISEVRASNSIKGLGIGSVFGVFDGPQQRDSLTDEELKGLVNQFPDGTVIADFFVPNMCKSSCMPMNFVVIGGDDEPDQTDIRLEMKYDEYCDQDDTPYQVFAEPEGGTLTIEGTTVSDNEFIPYNFKVENGKFRDIVISYSVDGSSKEIKVRVFKNPEVEIKVDNIDPEKRTIEFSTPEVFADSYFWDFGNGETSTEQNPGLIGFERDTVTVTLKIVNGICSDDSTANFSFENVILREETASCTSIDQIAKRFQTLDKISSATFKKSIEQYPLFKSIFIDKFSSIQTLPQKEQFQLLTGDIPVSVIQTVLKTLDGIIKSTPKQRRGALLFFEILVQLTLFYACCQKEDVNKAKVKTEKTLLMINRLINSWKTIDPTFGNTGVTVLKSMKKVVENELTKTISDAPHKSIYLEALQAIDSALNQLVG